MQDFFGVLAQERRPRDIYPGVREFDRHADVVPLSTRRMIELHIHLAQLYMIIFGDIPGVHDRAARDANVGENRHEFALGVGGRELLDQLPHFPLILTPLVERGEAWIVDQRPATDALGKPVPHLLLHHHVDIVVRAAGLALDCVAHQGAAGVVRGSRHRLASGRGLRILRKRTVSKPLVVAPLDAAKIHYGVHHRAFDVLAFAGMGALLQRGQDADDEMQAGS